MSVIDTLEMTIETGIVKGKRTENENANEMDDGRWIGMIEIVETQGMIRRG